MNEFIVWDKALNCFHSDGRVKLENGVLKPIGQDYTIHKGVGIKDIDGKKIYADCSIVEFEWLEFKNHKPAVVNKLKGYFSKDKRLLNYNIMILENYTNYKLDDGLDYAFYNKSELIPKIINIKIIDTIQENKLGLIK